MWRRLVLAVSFAAIAVSHASAQDQVAQFYKGRQINVIVGSSAGGGYDIYARHRANDLAERLSHLIKRAKVAEL